MSSLGDRFRGRDDVRVSFEFSPAQTPEADEKLWTAIERLAPLNPAFVSVTYGAGGSTRERTHATVKRIVNETNMKPAAHLTCVGASKAEINSVIQGYWDAGVRHIVAIRGDMPNMEGAYRAHEQGYASTADLVSGIKSIGDFEVTVSIYPERHPESKSFDHDIDLLKEKIDAGATRAIAQFAFETEHYERLLERVQKAGITIPIIPGIMPTTNFKGVVRMADRCGATVPGWLAAYYEGLEDDLATRRLIAATVSAEQVHDLERLGFRDFHLYTLNQADLTYAICHILGYKPT
jgi:methylenetetrahydrofolate reductase (NADH)